MKMKLKGMVKYAAALLLCLATLIMTYSVVLADVIWEPNDSFYKKHTDDCEYEDRTYIANGEKGYITVYKDPKSKEAEGYSENGNTYFVSFVYPKSAPEDKKWGIIEYQVEEKGIFTEPDGSKKTKTGWVKMEEMMVNYDHYSFYSDHREEFNDYSGGFDPFSYEDPILFWTFPGSGVIGSRIDMNNNQDMDLNFSYLYTDDEGQEWGYVGYFYASSGWVCLSDPTNEKLPVTAPNQEDLIKPSLPASVDLSDNDRAEGETPVAVIIIALVVGLVVITAVLIRIFWKKKPTASDSSETQKDA